MYIRRKVYSEVPQEYLYEDAEEQLFSVTMDEEELTLFSEFMDGYYEAQREYAVGQDKAGNIYGRKLSDFKAEYESLSDAQKKKAGSFTDWYKKNKFTGKKADGAKWTRDKEITNMTDKKRVSSEGIKADPKAWKEELKKGWEPKKESYGTTARKEAAHKAEEKAMNQRFANYGSRMGNKEADTRLALGKAKQFIGKHKVATGVAGAALAAGAAAAGYNAYKNSHKD